MPMKNEREYRNMSLSISERAEGEENETEEKRVSGYATTFNEPYTLFEDEDVIYREQVDPSAFDETDMSDVIMQYDHAGRVFARTENNTLTVNPDEKGLFICSVMSFTISVTNSSCTFTNCWLDSYSAVAENGRSKSSAWFALFTKRTFTVIFNCT